MSEILALSAALAPALNPFSIAAICWHCSVTLFLSLARMLVVCVCLVLHFQSVLSRHDIHALTVCSGTMFAVWPFTGTLNLMRATLNVETYRQNLHSTEKKPFDQAMTILVDVTAGAHSWYSLLYRLEEPDACLLLPLVLDLSFASVEWQPCAGRANLGRSRNDNDVPKCVKT